MGIGASIFLIALGAIIAYGVDARAVGWLDLDVVGWVMILAGIAGLLTTLVYWRSRRRTVRHAKLEDEHVHPDDNVSYSEEYRSEIYPPDRRPKSS